MIPDQRVIDAVNSAAADGDPVLIAIVGPTASGKTALALDIAQYYGCDIISADSRQVYRDIPIGTAAPTSEERQRVFHHFVGFLDLDAYYSAARFEEDVMALLPDLFSRCGVAVMCGGSMMYVDAVLKGIDEMPSVSESTRDYVLQMYHNSGFEAVKAQLQILDPEYYSQVDLKNPRRVIHAVEICLQSGRTYSSLRTGTVRKRPFKVVKVAVDISREQLFGRINARVARMIELGLVDEARHAFEKGNFNSLNTVGYKELAAYFRGEMDLPETVARIAKNTRVYAKKQMLWLRKNPDTIMVGQTPTRM